MKTKGMRLLVGLGVLATVLIYAGCLNAQEKEIKWNVTYTGTAKPPAPWYIMGNANNCQAEVKDGALLIADRGKEKGEYLFYAYPWAVRPGDETVAEAKMKLLSGYCGLVICNGVSAEQIEIYPDRIWVKGSQKNCKINTTDGFHVYRVIIKNSDFRLYVDGELKIDGAGEFKPLPGYGTRNDLEFGAANSPSFGEALFEYVRWSTSPAK